MRWFVTQTNYDGILIHTSEYIAHIIGKHLIIILRPMQDISLVWKWITEGSEHGFVWNSIRCAVCIIIWYKLKDVLKIPYVNWMQLDPVMLLKNARQFTMCLFFWNTCIHIHDASWSWYTD